jgi:plasmid maintenance system antidote protein VapI
MSLVTFYVTWNIDMALNTSSNHPGPELRQIIKDNGIAIGDAADKMGITRQALSRVLNGKAILTPEMAQRFATAFPADADRIFNLQAFQAEGQSREQAKEIMVRTHIPPFLDITARQIEGWADGSIRARDHLPALLRRLVNGSGLPLTEVDFPAFDSAQRSGWDGKVTTDAASPWVPRGKSRWEFGCDKNVAKKAEDDYQARLADERTADDRLETTFVFVTPRNWPGKDKWAEAKRAEGVWKDVRALDASDLEQWLEQCPAAQAWFKEQTGTQPPGLQSLDTAWALWAQATTPPLPKTLFRGLVKNMGEKLESWLKQAAAKPLIVGADSSGEAMAFAICALESIGQPMGKSFDGALVVETAEALKRVASLGANLVLITTSPEVEEAYPALASPVHLIIARRRNSLYEDPDISLDLVDWETFNAALEEMGIEHPDQQRYSAATANSPTILRRYRSTIPSIQAPSWSTDASVARKLIPLALAGVWDTSKPADIVVVQQLTGLTDADEIEQTILDLAAVEDAPTWALGTLRGVTSKIDALAATQKFVTAKHIKTFLAVAEAVLSEDDPALDYPEEERWLAGVHGRTREHSSALRRGLCETLVLLSAHGDAWFGKRTGNKSVEFEVSQLVLKLLTPLDSRTWSAHRQDLPRYAEAAPDTFMELLEQDLASPEPKVLKLLESADNTLFGSCPRSGLLWALERLAWKPENLPRVIRILAKLCEVRISDNWVNKPAASLAAIFRSWMPQTAASIENRNLAVATLCRDFPKVGWPIIVDQIGTHHAVGHYSDRPEWRNDASGAGQLAKTYDEIIPVAENALRLALEWKNHDQHTLGDLVEHMVFMPVEKQGKVWDMITTWAQSNVSDIARHQLRERIREIGLTRRARLQGFTEVNIERARETYLLLTPADLITRHLWLFEKGWIGEAPDDDEDDEFDYRKHDRKVAALRIEALTEIWAREGYDGVLRLSSAGDADREIGHHLVDVLPESDWTGFIDRLVKDEPIRKIDIILAGFLFRLTPDQRAKVISEVIAAYIRTGKADEAVRLLKAAPFWAETWSLLWKLPSQWQRTYWEETPIQWQDHGAADVNVMVRQLLSVNRPRAAFHAVHMDFQQVESKLLVELLRSMATSQAEESGHYRVDQFYVGRAFESLDKRPDLDKPEMVQLEFLYAEVLDRSDYGTPNLERALASDPQLFVQLVAAAFRRKDGGEDPPEWRVEGEERKSRLATVSYRILSRFSRLPGTGENGKLDPLVLRRWIDSVRSLGNQVGRAKVTDTLIGEMLGRSQPGDDGVWPSQPVCEAVDATASIDVAAGLRTGRYNTRGAHSRGPGGGQERALSKQYRSWASTLAYSYPLTSKVLTSMADGYDREAQSWDLEDDVRKRIDY